MPDFSVRSDSVNVEQIMEQIRARIREKRGVDYTEQQIRELAAVKLEKFLDPRGVRSDLLEQFKKFQPSTVPVGVPTLTFEDTTMFETHRGLLRMFRKLLNPILKLFFNPNAIIHALHTQSQINKAALEREAARERQHRDLDGLYFELIHNLVVELTRTGIDVKNLKMRVESLASRLEFNERRARALESAVVYKPSETEPERRTQPAMVPHPSQPSYSQATQPVASAPQQANAPAAQGQPGQSGVPGEGPGQRSRRRRRRRGRRSGGGSAAAQFGGAQPGTPGPGAGGGAQASSQADSTSTHEGGVQAVEEFEAEGGSSEPESGSEPGAQ